MIIRAFSHENFDIMCLNKGLNDDNIENIKDTAYISIICTEECRKYYLEDDTAHWFVKEHPNVLNLDFDDIVEDRMYKGHLFKAMSEEQAEKCVDFIEKNKGKHFEVHCTAGISRSGAVCQFIFDFFNENKCYSEEDFNYFNRHINPNNHVLTLLKRAFYKKNGLFVEENKDF